MKEALLFSSSEWTLAIYFPSQHTGALAPGARSPRSSKGQGGRRPKRKAELGQGVRGLLPKQSLTVGQAGARGDGSGQASCDNSVKVKLHCISLQCSNL